MSLQFDFRLFPDVHNDTENYSNYDDSSSTMTANQKIPFMRAYNASREKNRILLLGEGSMGKSTSLRVFEANMLCRGKRCRLYECKYITPAVLSEIERVIDSGRADYLVFDAYDELPGVLRGGFDLLISRLGGTDIRSIISSRFDPRASYGATDDPFADYYPIYMSGFSDDQLDSIVSKEISRYSGYYRLLRNTFFLSMHLELEQKNLLGSLRDAVKTEAEFIQQYFDSVAYDKTGEPINIHQLISLGNHLHNSRIGKLNRTDPTIPDSLRHIFEYITVGEGDSAHTELTSKQIKYLNYLHGLYIKDYLLSAYEEDGGDISFGLTRLFKKIAVAIYEESISTSILSESLYYAGQLLAGEREAVAIITALNSPGMKETIPYEYILCLFLGYNNDVAEDIPGVFEFYYPTMAYNHRNYSHVCDRIRELRAASVRDVKFAHNPMPQLEIIDIDNDIFYSRSNCLITKGADELRIGGNCEEIPECVRFICSYAFSHSRIKRMIIPSSVIEIEKRAFVFCTKLEELVLGEGVKRVGEHAFYNCSGIRRLHIKNPNMQIDEQNYHQQAFVGMSKLDIATIPTTAVAYLQKMTQQQINTLKIFQGFGSSDKVSMSLVGTNRTGGWIEHLRHLVVCRDVEEISEEAFIQFGNRLESIVVEEGNENYYSVDNCLISRQDETLVLGCKNSIIPKEGVKSIHSYAFTRCTELTEIRIPRSVVKISVKSFEQCYNLKRVYIDSTELYFDECAFIKCRDIEEVVVNRLEDWLNYRFTTVTSNPQCYSERLVCLDMPEGEYRIPEGRVSINDGAFGHCKSMRGVYIPASLTDIGGAAFCYATNIKEVEVEDIYAFAAINRRTPTSSPLFYKARLFCGGKQVRKIDFPEGSTVGRFAFLKTPSLRSVSLSQGCRVGEAAFSGCSRLGEVRINGDDIDIHPTAFRGCNVTVSFCGTRDEWVRRYQSLTGVCRVLCSDGVIASQEHEA